MKIKLKDLIKAISAMSGSAKPQDHPMIGKVCVVRTYSAGVHIGEIVSVNGTEVEMRGARRLYKWSGAFTLSEVSSAGIDPSNSRMSIPVNIFLQQAIELIPTTKEARATFEETGE